MPLALVAIRIVGAGFLFVYGILAAVRVFRPRVLVADGTHPATSPWVAVGTVLALTWLNPNVYLDTVVFLGSVGNHQGADGRWWFAGGAILASLLWFFGLGFGGRLLRPFFARAVSWRILDAFIAVVMVTIGVRLALGF